jgi:hypothetical protein
MDGSARFVFKSKAEKRKEKQKEEKKNIFISHMQKSTDCMLTYSERANDPQARGEIDLSHDATIRDNGPTSNTFEVRLLVSSVSLSLHALDIAGVTLATMIEAIRATNTAQHSPTQLYFMQLRIKF